MMKILISIFLLLGTGVNNSRERDSYNFLGKWYLKEWDVRGMVNKHVEYSQLETPEIFQFDSTGCFSLLRKNGENTFGTWQFDSVEQQLSVSDKKSNCNIKGFSNYYSEKIKVGLNYLSIESAGRDTKYVNKYEKFN